MKNRSPWAWIPSLYFAEGLPYVVVMTLSVILYKRMEVSNTDIALYTSWLYFPWVIKPIWSPFVDLIRTKRWWIYAMQLLIGAGMAGVAFTLPGDLFLRCTLAFFWLMAFSSATHDIAADGFYMLGLNEEQQAFFIGIRNTFYRVAMLTGQGLLVMLAGYLEQTTGRISFAWSLVFFILAGSFIGLALWHKYILPKPDSDVSRSNITPATILTEFGKTFVTFFQKKGILPALLFMLTYRLGESQLVKLASPFLLDSREVGGLALSTGEVGFAYGTVGVISAVRRCVGWHGHCAQRIEAMDLADGVRHIVAQLGLSLFGLYDAGGHWRGECLRGDRAVRLWLWLHRLHDVSHALRRGQLQDLPLCDRHGLHGVGHDAPRHDLRLDSGADRLSALLYLGDDLLHPGLFGASLPSV